MSAVRDRLHLVPGDLTDRVAAVWTLDTDAATPWTEHAWPTLHTDVVFVGGPAYARACVGQALPVAAHWLDVGTLRPRAYRHGPTNRLTGVRLRPGVGGALGAAGGAGPLAERDLHVSTAHQSSYVRRVQGGARPVGARGRHGVPSSNIGAPRRRAAKNALASRGAE